MLGYGKSLRSTARRQEEKGASAGEAVGRLNRFRKAMGDKEAGDNVITRLQKHGLAEAERQKKKKQEEAANKKKSVAPQKGFVERMMDKYWHKKEQ